MAGPLQDGNGIISGYNCRHRLIAWFPGSKAPAEYTESEIKKEYAIDKRQREYENRIRLLKTEERLLRAAGDTSAAKARRLEWRKLTNDYKAYSLENDRAFHMYRCIIDKAEEGRSLTEGQNNGILSVNWVTDDEGTAIVTKTIQGHQAAPSSANPFDVIDRITPKGKVERTFYDEIGNRVLEVHTSDHGNPKTHPIVPHIHWYAYETEKKKSSSFKNKH